jgi:hypothetical protein
MVYEYFNDQLGVQARFLFYGRNSSNESLQVISDRALRNRIEKGYIHRLRANGPNTPMLLSWLTLPPEWQRKLIEVFGEPVKQVKQSWFEKHYRRDTAALEFYISYRLQDGSVLPDAAIEEYTLNASVLNTVEKVYNDRYALRKAMRGMVKDIWGIVSNECNRFRDIQAHTLPTNPAALRRKLREYKTGGYPVLIHGNWCNKSAQRLDDHVGELLNNMFADVIEKPTATDISRKYEGFLTGYVEVINNETGEQYDPKEFPKISQSTITKYLAKWVNKAGTHALRSGNRQVLMSKFKPFHTLEQPKYAGSIISVDDRQPPFEYAKGKRVWFYNGIDLASEAITVWVYGTSKEGIILEFYRQLVRNYAEWGFNLPAELEGEMSLNSQFASTFLQEGSMFQYVRIEANKARGKRIEAYYKPLRYGLEKKREGWIARPFALSEANQEGPKQVPLIPYEKIIDNCLEDIQTWNNTEHSTTKGKTRWEYLLENQNKNIHPTNWRAFLPHLGYKTETSCNVGQIRLQNQFFLLGEDGRIAYSEKLIRLMEQVEGKDIDVYWLDGNDGSVMKAHVYLHGTDRYICEAVAKPTYNRARIEQTPEDMANLEAMSKYVASVDGFVNSRKRSIDKITVIDNRPKTLNNKFQINGMRRKVTERTDPVEVMPAINEDDFLNAVETTFKTSLKDRF